MLYTDMDMRDFEVAVETALLEDETLIDLIMSELEEEEEEEEEKEVNTETSIDNSEIDKNSFLYQICSKNWDCPFDEIFLIVKDASFAVEVYNGLAKDYHYNWNITVDSYWLYNENGKTFIEVWCNYPYIII